MKNILLSGFLILFLGLPFSLQAEQKNMSGSYYSLQQKPILLAKGEICKRSCGNNSKVICNRHP